MKINKCPWELDNIGRSTLEVNVDIDDVFNLKDFTGFDSQYIVVKVPTGKPDFRLGLPMIGFCQIESQFRISKLFSSFEFENPLIRSLSRKVSFCQVTSEEQLISILNKMTPHMFTSDRISVDPFFGPEIGLRRYRNWMRTEFKSGSSIIIELMVKGESIGFSMFRIKNDVCSILLGGIFENYQNRGLGMLTPVSPALYLHQMNNRCRLMETSISSNNFPVIEFYNYLNYKIDSIINVFIKHQ